MTIALMKTEITAAEPVARKEKRQTAAVVPLPVMTATPSRLLMQWLKPVVEYGLPPLVVALVLLTFWQIAAGHPGSSLPPPTQVWSDSYELIVNPFFDNGGTDKGLGLHVFASLQRVALGYALAAIVGIALGTLVGQSRLFMRGLDPLFQILRTVPPLAWLPISLAAFRDGQPSAIFVIFITSIWPIIINTAEGIRNIPQDYRNVARVINLNPPE